MPEAGVEPARPEGHRPLKTARLPVPPLRLRGRCQSVGSRSNGIDNSTQPHKRGCKVSGPGRSRTADTPVFSRVLYHLSYRAFLCGNQRTIPTFGWKKYNTVKGKSQALFTTKIPSSVFKETSLTKLFLWNILTSQRYFFSNTYFPRGSGNYPRL